MPSKVDKKCRNYSRCGNLIARENKTGFCDPCYREERKAAVPSERVRTDRELSDLRTKLADVSTKYKAATTEITRLERIVTAKNVLDQGIETFEIPVMKPSGPGNNEGTVIAVASDWHVGSVVKPGNVSGLNEFNLDIARDRATKFFRSTLRLTHLLQQDLTIQHMVLALLGDFITNDIHEEFVGNNSVAPMQEVVEAQNMIASGIEFLLNNSELDLVIPCHSGNHARTTKRIWWSSENGHSLEWLMYQNLAAYFRDEPRIKFLIPEGYHSYLDLYGRVVRFHHGHAINYQGGIGGIFIPAFKAIGQWDKARPADLDVFGHFHQLKDGNDFVSNGSIIGYDSYALSIKADFEEPRQALILMDKKRGRTSVWPVFVN